MTHPPDWKIRALRIAAIALATGCAAGLLLIMAPMFLAWFVLWLTGEG